MTATVALLVMTDGRGHLLDRALRSAADSLCGAGEIERWMHDDSGDDDHRAGLAAQYPEFTQLGSGPRRGFGGAIAHAWHQLAIRSGAEFVFHLEDDFVFRQVIDLGAMIGTLRAHPHLVQLALRRQPWNAAEVAAGGIVELNPADYTERQGSRGAWLEHRRFFTTNPSLYRRALCYRGWPTGPESEGRFGIELFSLNPERRAAFWGARDSGEAVEHIGRDRAGTGY